MRRLLGVFLLVVLCSLLFAGAVASQEGNGKQQRVRFARGRTTAVLNGSVVRGDIDRYFLEAREGQTMIVHVTSHQKNAVFSIMGPDGETLPGAEEGADTRDWSGTLPASGHYAIWVGPTRGNSSYTLEITIR